LIIAGDKELAEDLKLNPMRPHASTEGLIGRHSQKK